MLEPAAHIARRTIRGGYGHEQGDDDEASVPRPAEGASRPAARATADRSTRPRCRACQGADLPGARSREAPPPAELSGQTSSRRNPSIGADSQASKSSFSVAVASVGLAASSASALSHTANPINASLRRSCGIEETIRHVPRDYIHPRSSRVVFFNLQSLINHERTHRQTNK